jgi:multiple antibiotic resistance protein
MTTLSVLFQKIFLVYFLGGLVSLLTITNPVSKITLFLALAGDMDRAKRNEQARKACVYALVILTVSLFAGVLILETFGISYGALRIAGGMTVVIVGYRMLFQEPDTGAALPDAAHRDIAFFPLAMPGISGPGSIATVIGIATEIAELRSGSERAVAYAATVGSIVVTCIVIWLTLHSAQYVSRLIGQEGTNAATRMMGFLLICIGVQFVGSGIRSFMAGA